MFFHVQLWRGLRTPYISSRQLDKAEKYTGIWKKTALLLVLAFVLAVISAYFGIGSEQLSKRIYETTDTQLSTIKALFAMGQVLQSVLVTALIIFFPALIFWIFTDVEYRKLVVMQLYAASIFLIEKALILPMKLYWGLDHASSPFSIGVIAQYLTDYELISNFFGAISLFSIWVIILQFKYLRVITEKSAKYILILILSINLFMWVFFALFTFIKFEVLF